LNRTISGVIHQTNAARNAYHNNYDKYILALLDKIHGRRSNVAWVQADCSDLLDNLRNSYEQIRWLLLNIDQEIPSGADINLVNLMTELKIAITRPFPPFLFIDNQYFLVDKPWWK
jgi:hypothetical protein